MDYRRDGTALGTMLLKQPNFCTVCYQAEHYECPEKREGNCYTKHTNCKTGSLTTFDPDMDGQWLLNLAHE